MRKRTGATDEVRQQIFLRANFSCERCSETRFTFGTSIHHRKPRGMGGTKKQEINDPTNLIFLCGTGTTGCHGWIESNRKIAFEKGLLVRQTENPSDIPFQDSFGNMWKLSSDFGKVKYTP